MEVSQTIAYDTWFCIFRHITLLNSLVLITFKKQMLSKVESFCLVNILGSFQRLGLESFIHLTPLRAPLCLLDRRMSLNVLQIAENIWMPSSSQNIFKYLPDRRTLRKRFTNINECPSDRRMSSRSWISWMSSRLQSTPACGQCCRSFTCAGLKCSPPPCRYPRTSFRDPWWSQRTTSAGRWGHSALSRATPSTIRLR